MKAHKLPMSTQRAIARAKELNPGLTGTALAARYNCTLNQVYAALSRARSGELRERRGGRGRKKPARTDDPLGTFGELIADAITALKTDRKLGSVELVQMLDKVASILKTQQQLTLAGHLQRADAGFISALIRHFRPEATDDDVITIYHEVRRLWQTSLS